MYKSLLYTIRCLKQTGRNAERMSIIFLVPVLFIIGIAFLYGDQSSFVIIGDAGDNYKIGVINLDQLPNISSDDKERFASYISNENLIGDPFQEGFGNCFIKTINQSKALLLKNEKRTFTVFRYTNLEKARKAVQSRFISLCFIIESKFSKTVITGLNHRINVTDSKLILNTTDYIYSETSIDLIGDHSYARYAEATTLLEEMFGSFIDLFWISGIDMPGRFTIIHETISTLVFTEFDIYIPAFLIFVLISSSTGVAGIIGYEQEQLTIDRLKLSDFPSSQFLFGLSLTQITTTLLTMISIVVTLYFLGFPIQNYHQVLFMLLISMIAVLPLLGISLGIAAFLGGRMGTYLPSLIAIPLSFLTGGFIPLPRTTLVGDIQLWHLNPFYSSGELYRKIMILNLGLDQLFLDLVFLFVSGMGFFLLGAIVFIKVIYK